MYKPAKSLSIIIPVYNEERYLPACLDAIAAQTVAPDEVIVVDNNSSDKSAEIVRMYKFVKLLHEPEQGLIYARTAGFNAASGNLMVRIDADTRLAPNWLETLNSLANQHKNATGFTGRGNFYDTPLPRFFGAIQVLVFQYLQFPAMHGYTLWGANMAIRREAWQKTRDLAHPRNDIDEDIDLSLQFKKTGERVKYCGELNASMSLRRDQTNPLQLARYLSTWPRDYAVNKRYLAAVYITIITVAVTGLASLAWLVLLPFTRKLS